VGRANTQFVTTFGYTFCILRTVNIIWIKSTVLSDSDMTPMHFSKQKIAAPCISIQKYKVRKKSCSVSKNVCTIYCISMLYC